MSKDLIWPYWSISEQSRIDANLKYEKMLNAYESYGKNSNVARRGQSYINGFTGEHEFERYLLSKEIPHEYLNKEIIPHPANDNGDFKIGDQWISNVKVQYFGTEPRQDFTANLNYNDYKEDKERGIINRYDFMGIYGKYDCVFYFGWLPMDEILKYGTFRVQGEQLSYVFTVSYDMITIPFCQLNKKSII